MFFCQPMPIIDVNMLSEIETSVAEPVPEEESAPPRASSPPQLGRGKRVKRKTWKLQEQLPQPPAPLDDVADTPESDQPSPPLSSQDRAPLLTTFVNTATNIFGLFREYPRYSTHVPDDSLSLEDMSYAADHAQPHVDPLAMPESGPSTKPPYAPWENWSVYRLMDWFSTGSRTKSIEECDRLVHNVILSPDFNPTDIPKNFSARREAAKLDAESKLAEDGWKECSVTIDVPDGKTHRPGTSDPPIPAFAVEGLLHRSMTAIIKEVWTSATSCRFHFSPFRQFWRRASNVVERVYSEIYSSDAFIKAHREVQQLPQEPGCKLERVVCAIMLWSDSTQLANFGNASLWPVYMFFGNQSKYERARPSANACHHLAYIPKVRITLRF